MNPQTKFILSTTIIFEWHISWKTAGTSMFSAVKKDSRSLDELQRMKFKNTEVQKCYGLGKDNDVIGLVNIRVDIVNEGLYLASVHQCFNCVVLFVIYH